MTVQTHLADWLEGIGADGLMDDNGVRQYSTFALRYQSIALVDGSFLDLVPHYAPKIEERDAAQRQAGREEAEKEIIAEKAKTFASCVKASNRHDEDLSKRYAALVEAARKRIAGACVTCGYKGHCGGCAYAEIRKALSDLDNARKG